MFKKLAEKLAQRLAANQAPKRKRYFLVSLYIYNNNVLRKVFSDVAETDGEYPSRAHIRYQAVLTQTLNGFKCTHAEIGSIQELSSKEYQEYNHVPQYINDIQMASLNQKKALDSRKAQ